MQVFNHRLKSMEEKRSCGFPVPGRPGWPGSCTPWCGGWKVSLPVAGGWNQMMFKVPSTPKHSGAPGGCKGATGASAAINGMLAQPDRCHKDSIPGDLGSVKAVDGSSAGKQTQSIHLLCAVSIFSIPVGTGGDLLTFTRKTLDWLHRWVQIIFEKVSDAKRMSWVSDPIAGVWGSSSELVQNWCSVLYWTFTEAGDLGMGILEHGWYSREQIF